MPICVCVRVRKRQRENWQNLQQRRPMQEESSSLHYYEPSDLRLGCPIFLSHSGMDKGFTRFLEQALCNRGYKVFFDEKILPKGAPVSMQANILTEARNSKLGVLVLSNDFFEKTPSPMLELAIFVEHKVDLLPLFYELSVDEFKNKKRRKRWYKKWKTWVSKDVVSQWEAALGIVGTINGLEFSKTARDPKEYIDIVVDKVCEIIPSDLRYSNKSFQGKERLCKFVADMFEKAQASHASGTHIDEKELHLRCTRTHTNCIRPIVSDNLVAGVYGFGGTGKSSLCKALCDFYFKEFKGRVCHIDMGLSGGRGHLSRIRDVLHFCFHKKLSETTLSDEQLWNLFEESAQQSNNPVFLCIDNVVGEEATDEAETYVSRGHFPRGSKIFMTARELRVLQRVTESVKSRMLEEMPTLTFYEARNVFLSKMNYETIAPLHEEGDVLVNQCVSLCKLNMSWDDFHPLTLISLAAHLKGKKPIMWKDVVKELSSNRTPGLSIVFEMLDRVYEDLSENERRVYIDLALYFNRYSIKYAKRWLRRLYNITGPNEVEEMVCRLESSSLIHRYRMDGFYVHDLVKDHAKRKMKDECFFLEDTKVDCTNEIILGLQDGNRSYTRVAISCCVFRPNANTLDLSKLHRLEVLCLMDNAGIHKVILSQATIFQGKLRSFTFLPSAASTTTITFLEESEKCKLAGDGNRNRVFDFHAEFCDFKMESRERAGMMLLSNPSLAYMGFRHLVSLSLGSVQGIILRDLGCFPGLEYLFLQNMAVMTGSIDCPSLKKLYLEGLDDVESILGLDKSNRSLQHVQIMGCIKLQSFRVPAGTHMYLYVRDCDALERIDLCVGLNTDGEVHQAIHQFWDIKCGSLKYIIRGIIVKPECDQELGDWNVVKGLGIIVRRDPGGRLTIRGRELGYSNVVKWHHSLDCKVTIEQLMKHILVKRHYTASSEVIGNLSKIYVEDAHHVSRLVSTLLVAGPMDGTLHLRFGSNIAPRSWTMQELQSHLISHFIRTPTGG